MNWAGQHWYTYLLLILILTCSTNAAVYSNKSNTSKTIWFIFMTTVWLGLTYVNWISA